MVKRKRLSQQAISGQAGINLIERIVLEMGSKWKPNTSNDIGIDGWIELVDPASGDALGQIVAVQSKTTQARLPGETDDGFY